MGHVSTLSLIFFGWFIFIPVFYLCQLSANKIIVWYTKTPSDNPQLFNFDYVLLNLLLIFGITFIIISKTSSVANYLEFFVFFNILIFLLLLTVFHLWVRNYANYTELNTTFNVSFWLLFALGSLCFCRDFILFLFCIELVATVYLFFFLFYIASNTLTLLKFKNFLSNYLFISFFTLAGVGFTIFLLLYYVGTVDFEELNFLFFKTPFWLNIFVLLILLVKIGAPGVFFFKLELYKLLSLHSLIFFSISSLLINSVLLLFLFKFCVNLYVINAFSILFIFLISNIFLLVKGLQHVSFCQFLGISAINTWGLLLLFFLI